ncbi:MAG: AraC family transcriptional regulator [Bacteroidia bacterium]|nr:AraC family transcriptional regulator [Bacteroidia bacterium]
MKIFTPTPIAALKETFSVSKSQLKNQTSNWHYHDQLELIYIKEHTGTRFIGDSVQRFVPGDLILIGAGLPHMWLNDSTLETQMPFLSNVISVHFEKTCFGDNFFKLPEMGAIHKLLSDANRVFTSVAKTAISIAHYMEEITNMNNFDKTLMLLKILKAISEEPLKTYLASYEFTSTYYEKFSTKLNKVYKLVMENFRSELTLEHAADEVDMHPSSFSRYFKKTTRRTFTAFVNEIRIRYACKLLVCDAEKSISQIAREAGYENLSTFQQAV